ncbi:unnamed protein product [Rhizophagus irregularis]|nr:unnamed protein product [Rhizophagus irregularis]
MSLFFSMVGGMRKDFSMSKKFLDSIISDFETSKYNRDLCPEGLKVAKRCKDVLNEIDNISTNPNTPSPSPNVPRDDFMNYVENSKELQRLGDCLWKLSAFTNYVFTNSVNTYEEREKFEKLIEELEIKTTEFQNIIIDWKLKRSRWSSAIKKKIKALGKFSSTLKQKSLDAMVKDSLNLKIPIECIKVSYNFNGLQTFDTSSAAEVNPIFRGSRNHIKLCWYEGTRRIAEKKVGNFSVNDEKYKEMIGEIKFMKDLSSCNNILTIFGYCQRPSGFSIISRWEDYNLQTYLAENKDLDWIEKLSIARGIANVLNYCHKKDILHYDIRTENILLNQHFEPRLFNFRIDKKSTAPLDVRYNSPERIRGERYTKASEIYSFAMVLWEIQHHELPYNKLTSEEISEKILKGEYPPQKPVHGTPVEFQNIIERAWAHDPEERSNMEKLYNRLDILDSRNLLNQNVELINYNKEEESIDDNSTEGLESPKIIGKIPDIARGIKYHQNKQYKRAWKIFEEYESKSNDIDGKYWVGYYYLKGWHEGTKGTPNSRASVSFLKLAAESGHADAQYYYALAIINYGTAAKEHRDKDRTKIALDYLKSSAKQDHPDALKMLGGIINKGQYPRRVLSVLFSLNKMVSKQSNGFKVPSLAGMAFHVLLRISNSEDWHAWSKQDLVDIVCSKNRSDLTKNRRNALELIDRLVKKGIINLLSTRTDNKNQEITIYWIRKNLEKLSIQESRQNSELTPKSELSAKRRSMASIISKAQSKLNSPLTPSTARSSSTQSPLKRKSSLPLPASVKRPKFKSPLSRESHDPEIKALLDQKRELEKEITKVEENIRKIKLVLKYQETNEGNNIGQLIKKWRRASQETAEYLFSKIPKEKSFLEEAGFSNAWGNWGWDEEDQQKHIVSYSDGEEEDYNESSNQKNELEQRTMKTMLLRMGIDLKLIRWNEDDECFEE